MRLKQRITNEIKKDFHGSAFDGCDSFKWTVKQKLLDK